MQEFLTNKTVEKLKYDLVREGFIHYDDLSKAEELAKSQNSSLAQVLIRSSLITERQILSFIESKLHIPSVDLNDYSLDEKCLKFIFPEDAKKYRILPLFKIEEVLTVAMADPLDLFALNKVIDSIECKIEPVLCSETALIQKINEHYFNAGSEKTITKDFNWRDELKYENNDESQLEVIIMAILNQAISESTPEIHLEYSDSGYEVFFTQNKVLVSKGHVPVLLAPMFLSRLKSLAKLDSSISELPQLGKMHFNHEGQRLVASISCFPTIQSERVAIKIYKPPKKLDEYMITADKLSHLKSCLEKPGIILVCGASLSGKTSVIYSILRKLSSKNKNIMTLESIIKYEIPEINQCEFNENVGFNMDKAVRFINFQSPDIVYFEGITNREILEYFTSLAIGGKLVLTEFLTDNLEIFSQQFKHHEFDMVKRLVSCVIFVHSLDRIEILSRQDIQKYY